MNEGKESADRTEREMTNRKRLTTAIDLIKQAADELTTEGHACGACGLTRYENWSENRTAESLGGVMTKLRAALANRDLRDWLDGPPRASESAASPSSLKE
jgi:hypothetical protein